MPELGPPDHGGGRVARYGLRAIALSYLAILLAPLVLVVYRTFEQGIDALWNAVTTDAAACPLAHPDHRPSRCPSTPSSESPRR